jgi:hypothetical protein
MVAVSLFHVIPRLTLLAVYGIAGVAVSECILAKSAIN